MSEPKTVRIEVDFPVAIELTDKDVQALQEMAGRICERYEVAHPGRTMWPAGFGQKMLVNPLMLSDDEPIPFDDSVFHIDVAERENFDWPCAKCGQPQGDHAHCITQPPAGSCEYEPKAREPRLANFQPKAGGEREILKRKLDWVDYVEAGLDAGVQPSIRNAQDLVDIIRQIQKDTARLDFFDRMNTALNARYGTTYRWTLVLNHNVNRLMLGHLVVDLNDAEAHGLPSCRDAIDREMQRIEASRAARAAEEAKPNDMPEVRP